MDSNNVSKLKRHRVTFGQLIVDIDRSLGKNFVDFTLELRKFVELSLFNPLQFLRG